MSARTLALPIAIGFALLGCGGNVVLVGGATSTTGGAGGSPTTAGPSGGAGGSTVTMGAGGSGTGAGTVALVTTHPDPHGPCLYFSDPNPPNAIFVLVASEPITCAATTPPAISPYGSTQFSGVAWEVCFAVAPADFVPGTLSVDSLTPSWGNAYEADADSSTPCGGGGVLGQGAISITAVQASSVTFSLSGTDFMGCGLNNPSLPSDGNYTAPRCP